MSYAFFVKRLLGRALPVHVWLPRLFPGSHMPYPFFLMQGDEKAASFDAALFRHLLPKHEALVVGFRSLALIEGILPVSRCNARNIE